MYKVFAFLKRNAVLLSHDEYRAGHVGYHCCQSRRLKDIRGYLVNIWANDPLSIKMDGLLNEITHGEPPGFTDYWDGFPEVYFDNRDSWVHASTLEPTRATEQGLAIDPDWALDDGPYLFDPIQDAPGQFRSYHTHMEEYPIVPVERPERKTAKLMMFFRRNERIGQDEFQTQLLGRYSELTAQLLGLAGYTVNFRDNDIDAAITDFYPADSWGFTDAGRRHRQAFFSLWDGASELHFDSIDAFAHARRSSTHHAQLCQMEKNLFSSVWYVEVDENLIVMPNRDPAPEFYFR